MKLLRGIILFVVVALSASAQFGTSKLTNKSGGTVDQYDIVVVDTSNDNAFTTTTTERDTNFVGVVWSASGIANNTSGLIVLPGSYATVNVSGAVTRGDYLITSDAAAGQAESGGTDSENAIGIALETGTDTAIDCVLYGAAGTSSTVSSGDDLSDFTITTPSGSQLLVYDGTDSFDNVAMSGDATIASNGALDITTGAVERAEIANGAALSVIGRSANSTGAVADIAASATGQVLRYSGATIGFGALDLADSDAVTGELPAANMDLGSPGDLGGDTPGSATFTTAVASIFSLADTVSEYSGNLQSATLTTGREWTMPNKDGTVLLNSDWATPGAIGGTTPAAGSFTGLTMTGQINSANCPIGSSFEGRTGFITIGTDGGGYGTLNFWSRVDGSGNWVSRYGTANGIRPTRVKSDTTYVYRIDVATATTPVGNTITSFTPFAINNSGNVFLTNDQTVQGGDLDVGATGTTRGTVTAWRGSGTTPGQFELESADGDQWFLYARNDGTLAVHTTDVTADTDGTAIGSTAPAYASMQVASQAVAVAAEDTWYTVTGFTAGATDGSIVSIASSVITVGSAGKYEVSAFGHASSSTNDLSVGISINDGAPTAATGLRTSGTGFDFAMSTIQSLSATNTIRLKIQNNEAVANVDATECYVTVKRLGT